MMCNNFEWNLTIRQKRTAFDNLKNQLELNIFLEIDYYLFMSGWNAKDTRNLSKLWMKHLP